MKDKLEGYRKILSIIEEYDLDDLYAAKNKANAQVFSADFESKYGIRINPDKLRIGSDKNNFWVELDSRIGNMSIGVFGDRYGRRVLNIMEKVDAELLLCLSFPCGPYELSQDYPTELFAKFCDELKTHNPKYYDPLNKTFYFSMDTASEFFGVYPDICTKYIEENKKDFKLREAKRLREKADKLENSLND